MSASQVEDAAAMVAGARRVVIFTGAGVSAESGVPTFRGPEGLWRNHRPEELATPQAFARDARLVWEWYGWRRGLVAQCEPNAAHTAIATLAEGRSGVSVVTQNVDGLHALARARARGVERDGNRVAARPEAGSTEPLELHGSLFRVRCTGCPHRREHRDRIDASTEATLPRCSDCGALLRPDVVWFGEGLDPEILDGAFEAAGAADVCLSVGTSAVVQPAASVPLATRRSGGAILEVNPDETPLSPLADLQLRGAAAELLPRILTLP